MDYKVVSEIPPIQRGPHSSKYREVIEAAIEHGTVAVEFEDVKTAHSRAGSIRTVAQGFKENVKVTVRGDHIYVTTDETEAEKTPSKSSKKATKTAAKKAVKKKSSKKRPSKKAEPEPDEVEDLDEDDLV